MFFSFMILLIYISFFIFITNISRSLSILLVLLQNQYLFIFLYLCFSSLIYSHTYYLLSATYLGLICSSLIKHIMRKLRLYWLLFLLSCYDQLMQEFSSTHFITYIPYILICCIFIIFKFLFTSKYFHISSSYYSFLPDIGKCCSIAKYLFVLGIFSFCFVI